MASLLISASVAAAAAAGSTYPREGPPRIAAIATANFALFMLHPFVELCERPICHRYNRRVLPSLRIRRIDRSSAILLVDARVAQLESDLFLSAHDSVAHKTRTVA